QKYIPGNPTIVMEYMAGGGGRRAANHLYRVAKPDGLTIGNPSIGMLSNAVLGESGVQYDIDKFFYLGSPFSTYHSVFVSRKAAGLDTIEKLRPASGVRIGAQSVGFVTYNEGRLFAYILGLKEPKFVPAYSGVEIDPALLRGEIDARATGADTVVQRNRAWLEKGNIVDFHAIMEVPIGGQTSELSAIARAGKFRHVRTPAQGHQHAARISSRGHALRASSGDAQGPGGNHPGGFSQNLSGPRIFQGI
ncbi:MAG TPA: hypothetical protein VMR20_10400, partial [Verrucomicrobiae bacterium]|nr:hypothetical protein [Verrucomicrobiae bacterium]